MATDRQMALVGGQVLMPTNDELVPGTVVWDETGIVDIGGPELATQLDRATTELIEVAGRWVLPGIIDLHGDAFERCLMPRPGVEIDIDLALADNDRQLLAAGITTAYLSATDSWEPGLRSRATLRRLVEAIDRRAGGPDVRLHVRHERCNTDGHDELSALVSDGSIELLSYNDHTSDRADRISMTQIQRTGLSGEALGALQVEWAATRSVGATQERELADLARSAGCPTASHDPDQLEDLERDLALGVAIAEFPTSIELAERYRAEDIPVLLGAPNLVRGGSHLGNLAVADALAAGAGDILCSDYHYPSLLQAPFTAAEAGLLPFGEAWSLVSANPARAAGLSDRGQLAPGRRADVLVVDPPSGPDGGKGVAAIDLVAVAGQLTGRRS